MQQKSFCFLHNSIWIGSYKLSLLQREYLSSAVNVWTNSPQIFDMTDRDFLERRFSQSDEKDEKTAVAQIPAVFGNLSYVDYPRIFRNWTSYTIT